MTITYNVRPSHLPLWRYKIRFISTVILSFVLLVNTVSVAAVSGPLKSQKGPGQQFLSTLTFTADADAHVDESNPDTNFGTSDTLEVYSAENQHIESYVRFTVSGLSGAIYNATFRVYSLTEATNNNPAVYATATTWSETGLTWNNRWSRTSDAVDPQAAINGNSWVEYNVTSLITGDGEYGFLMVGDGSVPVRFSSREGGSAPQLVLTLENSTTMPSVTETPTVPLTDTPTSSTGTPTPTATLPDFPTLTDTPTPLTEITPSLTPAPTDVPANPMTFIAEADARAVQIVPFLNFGTSRYLQADGNAGSIVTPYIRFTIRGSNGPIQKATLRVFCTTNPTRDGPAVYLASSSWEETGLNGLAWNTQPTLLSSGFDNKGAIEMNSWVEYDVTSLITGDGTYTFALVADTTDGVTFSSREGPVPPELVVTPGTGAPTPTPVPTTTLPPTTIPETPTAIVSSTPEETSTPLPTISPTATLPSTLTSTPTTSPESVVLVGAGDISTCSNNNDEATAKLLDAIPGTVFVAGDNAYSSGTYTEYLNCYDPTWGRHKARTNPVPGNHEYRTSGAAGYFQYFNNVSPYYAYNLGAWRIYALNSEIDVTASGLQAMWLQADLVLNPSQCVLAYWHKPRWSSGSTHGNNSSMQTLWQILANAGAEVVINGHEHDYERFAEMDASGAAVAQGLREFVAGTGGVGLYPFGTPLATSQVRDNSSFGVLKFTLHPDSYDWQFVPVAGSSFTDSGSSNCH